MSKTTYEIEKRKHSSNCLIRVVKNGKEELRTKILSPFVGKAEGDKIVQEICNFYNSNIELDQ